MKSFFCLFVFKGKKGAGKEDQALILSEMQSLVCLSHPGLPSFSLHSSHLITPPDPSHLVFDS